MGPDLILVCIVLQALLGLLTWHISRRERSLRLRAERLLAEALARLAAQDQTIANLRKRVRG